MTVFKKSIPVLYHSLCAAFSKRCLACFFLQLRYLLKSFLIILKICARRRVARLLPFSVTSFVTTFRILFFKELL
jgi:hypothetical protein